MNTFRSRTTNIYSEEMSGLGEILLGFPSALILSFFAVEAQGVSDYGAALRTSLLFYEAQRSGKLPSNQRVQWRGDSALEDVSDVGIDLSGGYYDAGDHVKFGFPMAHTMALLSWGAIDFESKLSGIGELQNTLDAIRWGTDYFIKAHPQPDIFYFEVGDGKSNYKCWRRPEDMTTPRNSYKVTDQNPGADVTAEIASALAAASIAFRSVDPSYSAVLLDHARQDELVWAAAWLHRATDEEQFLTYLGEAESMGGVQGLFSWDKKYVGVQVLVAKLVLEGRVPSSGLWAQYKSDGEQFICNCVGKGNSDVRRSGGGVLWFLQWANLQYVGSASLVAVTHASYLATHGANVQCPRGGVVAPNDLIDLARSQMDYVLGNNPKGMSYMVGYGSNYPTQVHHRGASIVSFKKDPTPVTCHGGYDLWYKRDAPNPNVIHGAIVGGPDKYDQYMDRRSNYTHAESTTNIDVLATLA